jgi:hypothetical protein
MSMKLGAGAATGSFELCPAGPQQLVCCDIIDHGMVMSPGFAGKPAVLQRKVSIRWMSSYRMADQRPYIVQKRYTLSSHQKATLRQDLEKWRGRAFTDAEADAFDIDRLIGVNCFAQVVHKTKPRGTFAEVVTLMPPLPNLPKLTVDPTYVRVKDRPVEPVTKPATPTATTAAPTQQPDPFDQREPGDEPPDQPDPPDDTDPGDDNAPF